MTFYSLPEINFLAFRRLKIYTYLRPTEHNFFSERAICSEPPQVPEQKLRGKRRRRKRGKTHGAMKEVGEARCEKWRGNIVVALGMRCEYLFLSGGHNI